MRDREREREMLYIVNMLYLKKFNGAIRRASGEKFDDGWNTLLSGFFKKESRLEETKKK